MSAEDTARLAIKNAEEAADRAIRRAIQALREAADEADRATKRADGIAGQITSVLGVIRNAHNTSMGHLESAIRNLGDAFEASQWAHDES